MLHDDMTVDWTSEEWSWSPARGRWSPEWGLPDQPVRFRLSTAGVEPIDAYEYWCRTVFYHFDPAAHPEGDGFRADVDALIAHTGEFVSHRGTPFSGQRRIREQRRDDGQDLQIGLILAGERRHEQLGDLATRSRRGDFYAYDLMRPSRVSWDAHRSLHLALRRPDVEAALGHVPAPSEISKALSRSALAPFLKGRMMMLARHLGALSTDQRGLLLRQTMELALTALQDLRREAEPSRGQERLASLYYAATCYIDGHLGDHALCPEIIAGALGVSRASLYRAFSSAGATVAGLIRERRLLQARRLLAASPAVVTIAEIAFRCGYAEPSSFNRAFRARFGLRPGDVRGAARD